MSYNADGKTYMSQKGGAMRTKLREARKRQHLTQESVARLARISLKSYQRIEAGTQHPSVTTAYEIAQIVGETIDNLFIKEQ